MANCSSCTRTIYGLFYRFEQCSIHCFCVNCIKTGSSFTKLDCSDCFNVYVKNFENYQMESCFYCSGAAEFDTCKYLHKFCIMCIERQKIGIECYHCYIISFTICLNCKEDTTRKIASPLNPSQTICIKCFEDPRKNDCFIENGLNIQKLWT